MSDTPVHIGADGSVHIDGEPVDVPPGVDPARAVLQQLALDAAGSGTPFAADIDDARTRQHLRLQINTDGTSTPLAPGEPPASLTPDPALPSPEIPTTTDHDRALQAVHETGRAHDFTRAAVLADRLLADLTASNGEAHPTTLTTAGVRADLAWMSGDYRYAAELWTYIAQGWAQATGPASRSARSSARQAAASWKDVPDSEALSSGQELLAMLTTIAPAPETNATVLAVRRRISRLAAA
ncbi:hypothetical protein ACWC5I_05090 [Kitasatospora sp. NPDC001574]